METPPVVLSVAGFDPSSGAGITADVKTIAAHGCYATTCITALTVQTTRGVSQVFAVPAVLVTDTLRELASDLPPAAVRIGMLASAAVAGAVADFLEQSGARNVVLDPVLRSSSGTHLLNPDGVEILRQRLLPRADVLTPNLSEAAALTAMEVSTPADMRAAAARLHQMGARTVVLKGGHLEGDETLDLLSVCHAVSPYQEEFRGSKLKSKATHGTGCAFATALACNLALGLLLPEAVAASKRFVSTAIERAYPLGHGTGPLNHLFRLEP
ncbi:MAG: bifunctional hydroxymethylpyrimidine kinase/phosphomethylpyrimidine kinase [Terriglobales bacterium]